MNAVVEKVFERLNAHGLRFTQKPILIGGMAMEYYGMRKSGADIDLVICDVDYQALAAAYPENRKDIWGDLGVVIDDLEIWRGIMLLDYDFYRVNAADEKELLIASPDRLLLMRVFAMDNPKYMNDLHLIRNYYSKTYINTQYMDEQAKHIQTYQKNNGVVWGGKYDS